MIPYNKKFPLFFLSFLLIVWSCKKENSTSEDIDNNPFNVKSENIQTGDIIFQTSLSDQSKAIRLATNSSYSHCGIVYRQDNKLFVLEAVQPVKLTPLDDWISNGMYHHYVVKRLKNSEEILTKEVLSEMKDIGTELIGKEYDLSFEWTDDKIYCSELIWKVYQRTTGLEIGKLQKLKDFDLDHPIIKQKIVERYGNNIPLEETVISPHSIYESELLETVYRN